MLTSVEDHASCLPIDPATGTQFEVPSPTWYGACKVAVDAGLALVLLIATAPLMVVLIVLVKLTSRGPAIYSQERLGLRGRPYTIYKIRTMAHDCESRSGPRWSTPGDPRVTRIGNFLRATHLDELPQCWNVLRGEMSLVGPRPERQVFVSQFERVFPHYGCRMQVRPGLTGLAQVQLPPDTDLDSVRRKLACDLYYVQRVSLWLDLRILLSTVSHVMGIPFAVPRLLLRVPSGDLVERAYRNLNEAQALSGMQSA